ncbi:MAG: NAD(P)/FAD-dependent oxidoreductase [Lachnospiraceae bacterium]
MRRCEMLVIGGGPAGLSAAIEAAEAGVNVIVADANEKAGGQLFKQIHKFFGSSMHRAGVRGMDIGEELLDKCQKLGVEIMLDSLAIGMYENNVVAIDVKKNLTEHVLEKIQAKKIVIATGASENAVRFPGWTIPGVMGAGAAQTMVNFHKVLPGKKVLMIGSGNVGLIVSYQLMQAGAEIVGIVEALPQINGYAVHASKLTREGIPIYTGYTIVEALSENERVNKAVIAKVNPDWSIIEGSEITLDVDTITLGAGLKPLTGMAYMGKCHLMNDRFLGGWAPCHDMNMETTTKDIYVAGDASGVEEANTAIEEGKICGISIAQSLGCIADEKAKKLKKDAWDRLAGLRAGAHGDDRTAAKERQLLEYKKVMES